jgi:hypothetical protein
MRERISFKLDPKPIKWDKFPNKFPFEIKIKHGGEKECSGISFPTYLLFVVSDVYMTLHGRARRGNSVRAAV